MGLRHFISRNNQVAREPEVLETQAALRRFIGYGEEARRLSMRLGDAEL